MSAEDPAGRLEGLLSQHTWVRKLARTLVRDDADADDVAQEAWLAALRSPPTGRGSVRGWFGTVLRNAARQSHRGTSRRERREGESARPEGLPSTQEIVARAEEHRRVVDAVLALEEPYRTTVLLRFFDELPPREVAARMDVPVDTVRARIRRALERLREKLDAAHGGGGEAWKLALLPLAGLRPELVTGTLAAKSAAKAGAKAGAASATTPSVTSAMATGALTMGAMSTVAVGIVALAAGAGIVWLAGAGDRDALAKATGEISAAKADVASAHADAEKARADAKRKDEKIAELEAKRDLAAQAQADAEAKASKVQAEVSDLREEVAKLKPAADAKPGRQAFSFPEYGDALADVNWKSVAEHMTALVPAIDDLAAAIRDGKSMPAKAIGDTQKHNGPLVTAAIELSEKKVFGTRPNTAFTHPAFVLNALAAALDGIGKPLSSSQTVALEELGRRFSAENRERTAGYNDATFEIQRVVEDGDLRVRFFDALRKLLTSDQLNAVSPPVTRDRTSVDLWSSGLYWSQFLAPVQFDTTEKLGTDIAKRLSALFKVTDDAAAEKVRVIAVEWASRLPKELREREVDALEKQHWVKVDVVASAAGEVRKLVERVANELNLDGESLTSARAFGFVFVPTPKSSGK